MILPIDLSLNTPYYMNSSIKYIMKKVFISGSVFSIDPVRSVKAYARATFADISSVNYWISPENDKEIRFSVIRPQTVSSLTTLDEVTEGIVIGDDTNVTWNVEIKTVASLKAVA